MVASVVGSFWHDQNFSLINQYLVLQPKWYRGRSRCGDRRSRSHQGRRPDKIVHLQIIFSSWKHLGSSRSGVSHCGVVGGSSNDGGTQPLSKNRDWLPFKSNPHMLSRYIKHWIGNFGPSTLLGVFSLVFYSKFTYVEFQSLLWQLAQQSESYLPHLEVLASVGPTKAEYVVKIKILIIFHCQVIHFKPARESSTGCRLMYRPRSWTQQLGFGRHLRRLTWKKNVVLGSKVGWKAERKWLPRISSENLCAQSVLQLDLALLVALLLLHLPLLPGILHLPHLLPLLVETSAHVWRLQNFKVFGFTSFDKNTMSCIYGDIRWV